MPIPDYRLTGLDRVENLEQHAISIGDVTPGEGVTSLVALSDVTGTPGTGKAPVSDGGGNFPLTDIATQAELNAALLALNGDNVTTGTVADVRIASTIARDSEVTTAINALSTVYQPLATPLTNLAGVTNTPYGRGLLTLSNVGALYSALSVDTDGALAASSDTKLASQKAVKTYVDAISVPVARDISISERGVLPGNGASTNQTAWDTVVGEAKLTGATIFVRGVGAPNPINQIVLPNAPITIRGDSPTASVFAGPAGISVPVLTYDPTLGKTSTIGAAFSSQRAGTQGQQVAGTPYIGSQWTIENIGFTTIDGGASGNKGWDFPTWDGSVFTQDKLTLWANNCIVSNMWGTGIDYKINGCTNDSSISNTLVFNCEGRGIDLGSDSRWINCVAANNGYEGFYVSGKCPMIDGCKSWSNGTLNWTRGIGLYISGEAPAVVVTNFYTQDNFSYGVVVDTTGRVTIAGLVSDRDCAHVVGSHMSANGVNALNSAVINVISTTPADATAGFAASGTAKLGGVSFTYTGLTATSFTGCGNHAATTGGEAFLEGTLGLVHSGVYLVDYHDTSITNYAFTDSSGYTRVNPTGNALHSIYVKNTGGNTNHGNKVELAQATSLSGYDGNTATLGAYVDPNSDLTGTDVSFAGRNAVYATTAASTTTFANSKAGVHSCTLGATGISTIVVSDFYPGQEIELHFLQDGTGGRNLPAAANWSDGTTAFKFNTAVSNTSNTAGKRTMFRFRNIGGVGVQISPANTWF